MKKIVNFCPTGTQTNKENSFAPIFANEIIEEVLACYEIGITMVHLHARDELGLNTYKRDTFQVIIDGIKKYLPDLVICVSLSGRYFNEISLRTEVLSLEPDLGSLTMSSLNFARQASINEPDVILALIDKMNEFGVHPEIECFDSGMLNYTNFLIKKGILKDPVYINVIFGNVFNAQTDLATVSSILQNIPENAKTCFGGIGKDQLKANILGLVEADGIRIGLEDNLYFRNKEKASNEQLLKRIHTIMQEMDYSCMSSLEFKNLGYGNKKAYHFG
ncbi:Uncharacterized conserved protein, DUF849 family [Pseudarcicella hirudinis]|uniref:Uncharacterized conserved protein, DUF849 family n=1 Tax=Pseudarcicella hirudinis TaxID=1079859 RepID=A0A1I5MEU5_9BACT|nr:3-keto-5-aminohexanoate cleavage protein [Pseudarcicella hirudinis]SFP08043.1 Uncharacterized conserved protein, DUF849 family [Pseudarcicella hirudinis]